MSEWISVKDRLPKEGARVIYYFKPLGMFIGKFQAEDEVFYSRSGFLSGDVTHWMPLPEPPQ